MSPFGPYADFDECVLKNGDKSSPEGFCAWLHHKITGTWPSGMSADKYPEPFWNAYDAAMVAGKSEKEAYQAAEEAAKAEGYEMSRFGWVKTFQAPAMKTVAGVVVFAAGTWTDSAGFTREWTTDDLDKMVAAFEAGVPGIVPLKCGHTSDDFNRKVAEALGVPVEVVTGDHGQGQISVGKGIALKRRGDIVVMSFDNVPEPIANLIEGGQYSTVSVEVEDEIGDFGPAITGVALLGAEEPAVDKATLERALVFGGVRQGARVWSFKVGDDLPDTATLRKEFDEIRGKLADVIKGKRGAPIFRALFGSLAEQFEKLVGNHTKSDHGADKSDPSRADKEPNSKGGNKTMKKLPNALQSMKPEEIRALSVADLVKKFQEGEELPKVEDLQAAFQDMTPIAAVLGLGEEATIEEIVAAIQALLDKGAGEAPPEGEMQKEFTKATDRIAVLEAEKSVREWEDKTREFTAIPGTSREHAVKLADIEAKAGKDAAETQYAALKAANDVAARATEILGTNRKGASTDFNTEVAKYQKENPNTSKSEAIKAVAHARPDLYAAQRVGQ